MSYEKRLSSSAVRGCFLSHLMSSGFQRFLTTAAPRGRGRKVRAANLNRKSRAAADATLCVNTRVC